MFFGFLERALRRKEKNDGPARGPSTQVPRCSRRQVRRPQDFAIPGCLPLHFHHYCHKAQGKRTAGQEEAPWGGACEAWPALGGRAGPQAEVPLRRPPQAGEGAVLARRGPRGLPKRKPPAPLRALRKKAKASHRKKPLSILWRTALRADQLARVSRFRGNPERRGLAVGSRGGTAADRRAAEAEHATSF